MAEHRQLFVSCEHGGNDIPPNYQPLFSGQQERLNSHSGYDLGALPLARMLAKGLGAPLEKSEITRLLVDLNRSLQNHKLFSDLVRPLDRLEKARIVEQYYLPYRRAVTEKIGAFIANGAQVVHLSVHSFTPNLRGQVRNAELGVLYDPGRRVEKQFGRQWQRLLKQRLPGARIRCNYPYRGTADGLVRTLRGALNPEDYLGIELEINQALLGGKKNFPQSFQTALLASLQELLGSD